MNLVDAFACFSREIGLDTVFGLPGVHNLGLFDAFKKAGCRIYTAVHEQGAAFMADGYARSTGHPAICLVIDGPGFLNAATAIAQAHADSVPMLVVSPIHMDDVTVNGRLHEVDDQEAIAAQICARAYVLRANDDPNEVFNDIAHRFFNCRPRPLHVQVPLEEINAPFPSHFDMWVNSSCSDSTHSGSVKQASSLLNDAHRPIVVVGGGSVSATQAVRKIAEVLDSPCLNTVNGKGVLPTSHPLRVGGSPSLPSIQQALYEADAILALGTEFGETDFGFFFDSPLKPLHNLVRVDIDRDQLDKNQYPSVGLCGSVTTVLDKLAVEPKQRNGRSRTNTLRRAFQLDRYVSSEYRDFLSCVMACADVVVGDSCQPTYHASWSIEPELPRSYFHSVTGFGTLGYALPASLGAKLGNPHKRVVSLIGDGGLLYTLTELHTAKRYQLALPVIVWNNDGYNEIEKATCAAQSEFQCPKMASLDYEQIAAAFKIAYEVPNELNSLKSALTQAYERNRPTLIHVNQADFINTEIGNWYQ